MSDPKQITRRQVMRYGAATAVGLAWLGPATRAAAAATTAAAPPLVEVNYADPTGLYPIDAAGTASPVLTVTFNSPAALSGTIAWSVSARGTQEAGQGRTGFTAPAGQASTTSVPLGTLGPDYYAVAVTVTDAAGTQLLKETHGLGVLRPTIQGRRPGSCFGMGIRGESAPLVTRQIAQRIGVKWTRGVFSVLPDTVCPSRGVFWGQADIDRARAEVVEWHGYGIEPTGFINYNMSWNVQPGADGKPVRPHQNRPKDMVAQADMVYHAIAPLQDLVKNWEVWNEPWVHGWAWQTGDAQDYRDMTKLIWDRVKPEFPDVNLLGGGSVSYNRDIVYARGSKDTGYIDGSVNHAYGYPDATQYAMAKTQIKMDRLWSRTGGRAGQWQTELGTAEVHSFPGLPPNEAGYAVARTLAPTHLLHMLAGAEEDSPMRIFWFSLCYDKPYSGQEFNIYDIKTKSPRPAVVAYATMTGLLEDCELLTELYPKARSTWGFLFKAADGHGRAAVYADQLFDGTMEHQDAGYKGTLTLHRARGVRVYDYLGRLLFDGEAARTTLKLSPWEVLYFDSDLSPDELKAALTTGAVFAYDTPLAITPLPFTKPVGPDGTVDVRVENVSPHTLHAMLRVTAPEGWKIARRDNVIPRLKPGEARVVSIPVVSARTDAANRYAVGFEATILGRPGFRQTGSRTVQVAHAPFRTITVGAAASQWEGVVPVTMTGGTKEYTFQTAWDSDFLHFRAQIQDDLQVSNDPFPVNGYLFPFKADSIQLAFDAVKDKTEDLLAGDAHYDKAMRSISHLYVATLAKGGLPELHRQLAPGTNYQTYYPTNAPLPTPLGTMDAHPDSGSEGRILVTRDEAAKVTTYEVALAWDQLPELAAAVKALPEGAVHEATMGVQVQDSGTGGQGTAYWTAQNEAPASGCYNFAPFWSSGAQFTGGRVDTRWGIGR
ncbi:hypothetical protein ACFPOI_33300 [Nonomuraea angiospora]|uniref:Uncharacterized protein n=1 Tax=Nonomuraea angiospora TaxID=46172 RepID=A0ABR9LSS4_9ACTN|nr:hypothetical protein [Nonomuraea angiospora]MBE1583713.1 hypothetical protein [Nonomuraea angiospora]